MGQLPSHDSPASTKLLRQTEAQSSSLRLLHPGAQHPSPLVQLVTAVLVHKASHPGAEPFNTSAVQLLESLQVVGQLPSQTSFASTTLLPQLEAQSGSLLLLHPLGQHPSPFPQAVMSVKMQVASQFEALPLRESEVQATPSLHVLGQFPSQTSPASTTLLAQTAVQSSSFRLLHPGAQHPSEEEQAEMGVLEQSASQVLEEPNNASTVQAFWSSQLAGQSPSQISPASINELPQTGWQSLSKRESHPVGQHPSESMQDRISVLLH